MNILYNLPKIPYAYDAITLRRLYESPLISDFTHEGVVSSESLSVYGELRFPEAGVQELHLRVSCHLGRREDSLQR